MTWGVAAALGGAFVLGMIAGVGFMVYLLMSSHRGAVAAVINSPKGK